MAGTRNFFIAMALIGTLVPWYFFGGFIAENGLGLGGFVAAIFNNGAAAGAGADLVLSSTVFWVWSFYDARNKGVSGWWMMIPATLLIGLSLALPAYLAARVTKGDLKKS